MMLSLKSRINKAWKGWKLQPFRPLVKDFLKIILISASLINAADHRNPLALLTFTDQLHSSHTFYFRPAAFLRAPAPFPSPAAFIALPSAGQQISRPCFLRYLCFFRLLLSARASVALTGSHKEKQRTFTGGDANNQVYWGRKSGFNDIALSLFFSSKQRTDSKYDNELMIKQGVGEGKAFKKVV